MADRTSKPSVLHSRLLNNNARYSRLSSTKHRWISHWNHSGRSIRREKNSFFISNRSSLTKCRKVIGRFSCVLTWMIWLLIVFDGWVWFKHSSKFERTKNVPLIFAVGEIDIEWSLFESSWELTKNSKDKNSDYLQREVSLRTDVISHESKWMGRVG